MNTNTHYKSQYTKFTNDPTRIDGAVQNCALVRKGHAYDYNNEQILDAVELAFSSEPHGNMRTLVTLDLATAKALRDQLNALV